MHYRSTLVCDENKTEKEINFNRNGITYRNVGYAILFHERTEMKCRNGWF